MVKKLVDNCWFPQLPPSLLPHDVVSTLGPMYDAHDKIHLPKMKACGYAISQLEFVHCTMQKQKISSVAFVVKDAMLQFPVFIQAMQCQDDIFRDLKMVYGIGCANRACFVEVVGRKESLKLYMGRAGRLAEIIATEREAEVRRRKECNKAYGSYFPRYMLAPMGLDDVPSQCDVNIAPFDTNLLDIDITNLHRYAPEYMSMMLKSDQHVMFDHIKEIKSAIESAITAEVDDIVVDNLEKDDIEKLFEGSELVEIAGTSKMEVENAKLKADLASAIIVICSLCPEIEYASLDDSKVDSLLKNTAEKTAEALRMKDKYAKQLQSTLKAKQKECLSYKKRIQELEQRLSDQYVQGQKLSDSKVLSNFRHPSVEASDYKPESCDGGEVHMPCASASEPMDEISSISSSMDSKLEHFIRQPSKGREGVDDHMMDYSRMLNTRLDSSMLEPHREELQVVAESKLSGDLMAELQGVLAEKSNQLSDTGNKLRAAMEEIVVLNRELEMSRKLLDESQMN
ncbi:hypothetical protein K2173_015849 [Erythroxylum novogranatense]|uniref:Uncharacterized protein n=1 Tax=Erythroxylum novogranatense TaxID=1862640 RepID=A0AAV8SF46_9ROSI|nr:hypothetical protein K2173_015849 [Erythroxylum novogranatense]